MIEDPLCSAVHLAFHELLSRHLTIGLAVGPCVVIAARTAASSFAMPLAKDTTRLPRAA